MKTPKDRARHPNRKVLTERDRRRAHLAAGGTIANYDTSHYADQAPEGWNNLTPETMDEMNKAAEQGHLDMGSDSGTVNVLDSSTYGDAPF